MSSAVHDVHSLDNDPRGASTSADRLAIRMSVHHRLLETLDLAEARRMTPEALQAECVRRIDVLLNAQGTPLSASEKKTLLRDVVDEIFGLGPLEEFLRDPTVSDILVNGPQKVYVERAGVLTLTDVTFRDDQHLVHVIQRVASKVGRRIDEGSPMLDARLLDGSRVNAIIHPLALDGAALSIRRFGTTPIDVKKLVSFQALTDEMAEFLHSAVNCALNIVISGGTGSGKTTLLNVLSGWIPPTERVITIEDAAELRLQREHVVRLETRPPNIEGRGEVAQRDLVKNCLRMRPDRIIMGECRGAEALDMLQAMNTGHEGSMTTVHSNTPRDALGRIENMVSMSGFNFPVRVIRQQMASAINIVVQLSRLTGGKRRIMNITEVTGMEGDMICSQDLFLFKQTGIDSNGHACGSFECCGIRPKVLERIEAEGFKLNPKLFERRRLLEVGTPVKTL